MLIEKNKCYLNWLIADVSAEELAAIEKSDLAEAKKPSLQDFMAKSGKMLKAQCKCCLECY